MATIYDVARRAAVTAATVSNVITGKGSVGDETRARVQAAIEELNYRPNLMARGLARRRSYTLALILPNIANPFYPEIALEVERIAGEHGYHLMLCNTHYDADVGRAHLQGLSGRWVDGILAMAGGIDLADVSEAAARGVPIVLCNWEEAHLTSTLPSVDVDFRHGGELAAQHLLDLGHRRCGVVVHRAGEHNPSHARRLEGFQQAWQAARAASLPDYALRYGDSSMESGYRAAQELLALAPAPTALFATNDLMALGAIEAAVDRGLRVPGDVSIVGFDDIILGAHVRPSLTTVAIPKRELAMEATKLLLRHVESDTQQTCHLTLRPHLVARHSSTHPGTLKPPD